MRKLIESDPTAVGLPSAPLPASGVGTVGMEAS